MSSAAAGAAVRASTRAALSREQLQVALEAAHVGGWEWNVVTGEMLWSDEHEQLFGLSSGSFGGNQDDFLACVHPDDRPRVLAAARHAVETCGLYEAEYRVPTAPGSWRWIAARGRCVESEGGRALRFAGAVWDVTDRKEAQQAGEREAERARLLARATNDAVWDWDLRTDQVWWNESAPFVLRCRPEELQPDFAWWAERVHPDDRAACVESLRQVVHSGESSWRSEYRFRTGDGRYIHVVDRAYVQRDAEGLPARVIGAMLDVTEQREREAELAELLEEARRLHARAEKERAALDEMIEQFPTALSLLRGPAFVFERLNRRARDSWGPRDPLGLPLRETLAGVQCDELFAAFAAAFATGRPWHGQALRLVYVEDGRVHERFVDVSLQPLFGPEGEVESILCLRVDVTSQVRARHSVEELARRLDSQRAWFEAVLDQLPMPLVMLEPGSARLTFANKAASLVAGARSPRGLDPRARTAASQFLEPNALERAAGGEQLSGVEVGWTSPQGELRTLALYSTRMQAMHGQPATVVLPFLDVTELKRVQHQLERTIEERNESLALLDAVFAAAPVGFAYCDRDLRYRRVNEAMARLNGRPPAAHLGLHVREVLPPEAARAVIPLVERVFETGEPIVGLEMDGSAVGDARHFLAGVYPVKAANGQVAGAGVVVLDITERRQAEMALAEAAARERALREQAEAARREAIESQLRYQSIGDAIPFGIFVSDAKGRPEYVSQSLLDFVGTGLGEVRAEGWGRLLQPSYLAEDERRRWKESALSGRLFEAERPLVGAKGEERWILTRGQAVRDPAGRITSWVGINLDITDRKLLEQHARFLSDASTSLATSLELPQMLATVGRLVVPELADWCAIYLRDEMGLPVLAELRHPDEALALEVRALLHALPERPAAFVPSQLLDDPGALEERFQLAPGQKDALQRLGAGSLLAVPFLAQGRPAGALLVGRRTGTRRFGVHHQQLFEELARRLSVAVENAQLYEAAQRANRAKDEFLATLSHELRTPMTPLLAWVHILKTRPNDQLRVQRALSVIERSAKAQAQLVEDLLDVSRIITGKLKLELGQVDVREQVLAALETTRPAAEQKAVEVQFESSLALEPLVGDAHRLRQVVWNLVSNAVKFSRDGGRVQVRLSREADALLLSVTDDGEGIAPEFLPHVFERFRQADPTSTRAHGGLGLGLAIVKHIVEEHGGRVQATSEGLGHGATFSVRLPLTRTESAAVAPFVLRREGKAGGLLPGMRILVVDDAEDSRVVLAEILRDEGALVLEAGSAAEALRLAAENPIDLVLSDIGMPGGDGHTLVRALRHSGRQVPAIALTGYASTLDREKAEAAGFQRHLAKPVDVELLLVTIRQLTRG